MFKFSGSLDFMDFTKIIVKYSSKGTRSFTHQHLLRCSVDLLLFLLNERGWFSGSLPSHVGNQNNIKEALNAWRVLEV